MIRTIEIKGRTGRFDVPSFLLTENEELTLKIETREIRVGRYVLSIRLNAQKKTVYLGADMSVTLSAEWLNEGGAGVMGFALEFRTPDGTRAIIPSAKGEEDKHGFFIEPLIIEKLDDSYTAVGWLSVIEERQARLEETMQQIRAKLTEFEDNGVPLVFEEEIENE